MTPDEILEAAKQINPAIKFVYIQNYSKGYVTPQEIWAHEESKAYNGDTLEELLQDIKETM